MFHGPINEKREDKEEKNSSFRVSDRLSCGHPRCEGITCITLNGGNESAENARSEGPHYIPTFQSPVNACQRKPRVSDLEDDVRPFK